MNAAAIIYMMKASCQVTQEKQVREEGGERVGMTQGPTLTMEGSREDS